MTGWKLWLFMIANSASMVGCFAVLFKEANERPRIECENMMKFSRADWFYDKQAGCMMRQADGVITRAVP